MNKFTTLVVVLFSLASAEAAFTPGRYEIQNLGGQPIGTLAVSSTKATFEEKPATKITWEFVYSVGPLKSKEKHEAYLTKEGLWYFRKEVVDEKGKAITQGHVNGDNFVINIDDHGKKYSLGVPRKDFVVTDYDLETPRSPFWGLKLKEAKSAGVFSTRELSAISARRNVNNMSSLSMDGKPVMTQETNTSYAKHVVTSYFTPGHVLLKEQWPDRQFVRVGD